MTHTHRHAHTLRDNYSYLTLVLSSCRLPFPSCPMSPVSPQNTVSGGGISSGCGISAFHLMADWCLRGQKDEKEVYERSCHRPRQRSVQRALPVKHLSECPCCGPETPCSGFLPQPGSCSRPMPSGCCVSKGNGVGEGQQPGTRAGARNTRPRPFRWSWKPHR